MKNALCLALALALITLAGCRSQAAAPGAPGRAGDKGGTVADWKAEQQRLAAEFVRSLTEEQVAAANGADGGLGWAELTKDQQVALRRLWELTESILFSKPGARERAQAAGLAEPGPIEYAQVRKVGYAFVGQDDKAGTLYGFESERPPIVTQFRGTVAEPSGLTPALEEHGISLTETGEGPQ